MYFVAVGAVGRNFVDNLVKPLPLLKKLAALRLLKTFLLVHRFPQPGIPDFFPQASLCGYGKDCGKLRGNC